MLIANPVDEMWRTWQPICDDTSANAVALDVYENDDQYIVTAALPCMHVDNVKLHDDFLTIEGGVPEQTVENALCRLPSASRGEWLVKQPTGNHGEVHSRQECDAKSSYLVEAKMKKVTE